jgi:glycosyltransferase involved in cell wall biosynthesis
MAGGVRGMSGDIIISVIVPVYNAEKYLNECIDSLIGQTFFYSMEVILIDDGSTDNSPSLCDSYSQKHENIKVIHQENSGVSVARNRGIEKAQGKYIGFVDADDYVYPEMYERLFKLAEERARTFPFAAFYNHIPTRM